MFSDIYGKGRVAGCPYQDILDGDDGKSGDPLHKTVEAFAADNNLWISEFASVWDKMSKNGYTSSDLDQGPENFWTHF